VAVVVVVVVVALRDCTRLMMRELVRLETVVVAFVLVFNKYYTTSTCTGSRLVLLVLYDDEEYLSAC